MELVAACRDVFRVVSAQGEATTRTISGRSLGRLTTSPSRWEKSGLTDYQPTGGWSTVTFTLSRTGASPTRASTRIRPSTSGRCSSHGWLEYRRAPSHVSYGITGRKKRKQLTTFGQTCKDGDGELWSYNCNGYVFAQLRCQKRSVEKERLKIP